MFVCHHTWEAKHQQVVAGRRYLGSHHKLLSAGAKVTENLHLNFKGLVGNAVCSTRALADGRISLHPTHPFQGSEAQGTKSPSQKIHVCRDTWARTLSEPPA